MQGKAPEPNNRDVTHRRAFWQALVAFAVAGLFYWRHRPTASAVVATIGAIVLVSGLFIPPLFRRIEQAGQWLGKAVGVALTWALLVPLFYLVFLPGRLILLATRHDPMCRRFPSTEPTYWIPHRPAQPGHYTRQF
jgi:hypothetical protein